LELEHLLTDKQTLETLSKALLAEIRAVRLQQGDSTWVAQSHPEMSEVATQSDTSCPSGGCDAESSQSQPSVQTVVIPKLNLQAIQSDEQLETPRMGVNASFSSACLTDSKLSVSKQANDVCFKSNECVFYVALKR
jgi:hypothetical protein